MQILTIILALVALAIALVARLPLPIAALITLGVFAVLSVIVSPITRISTTDARKRPRILTVWLVLIIMLCLLFAVVSLASLTLKHVSLEQHHRVICVFIVCVANIVFAYALICWKRWGFWGLLGISGLALVYGIVASLTAFVVFGLANAAILGGLWIRTQNKNTWEQLQ